MEWSVFFSREVWKLGLQKEWNFENVGTMEASGINFINAVKRVIGSWLHDTTI